MTERDKLRICKGILIALANVEVKLSDINVTSFKYHTTTTREGFKQHNLSEVEFNNGTLEFLLLNHTSKFTIKNLDDYCDEDTIVLKRYNSNYHFNVVEITNYIDGKPKYITQLFLTVCYHDRNPSVIQVI